MWSREQTVREDSYFYEKVYGQNPLHNVNFKFLCYQSAYKYKLKDIFENENPTIVIFDEIHDCLTPVYYKFVVNNIINKDVKVIGLSATIDKKTEYTIDNNIITKEDLIDSFAPIVYKYRLDQGINDGVSRKLKVYYVKHSLSNEKNIRVKTKQHDFMTSEYSSYEYADKAFKKAIFLPKTPSKDFLVRSAAANRAKILYKLKSKTDAVKKLLKYLPGRTIIFGNDIDSLMEITPNTICSKNTSDQNDKILKSFQKGELNIIASFKMLEQGANLKNLQNVILHSYYGKTKSLIQRLGRLRQDGTVGRVFIFVTEHTQEPVWFNAMMSDIDIDVTICDSVINCIEKIT